MEPSVITAGAPIKDPVPQGWTLRPIGTWQGRDSLIAYDSSRHDVFVARLDLDQDTWNSLDRDGWAPQLYDHGSGRLLWVKDRLAATRAPLGRNVTGDSPDPGDGSSPEVDSSVDVGSRLDDPGPSGIGDGSGQVTSRPGCGSGKGR